MPSTRHDGPATPARPQAGLGGSLTLTAFILAEHVERLVNMVRTTSQTLAESFHLQPVCSTMLFQGAHNEVAPTKTDEDAQPLKIEA